MTRLNRRSLALLAGLLALGVLGATVWSLQPKTRREVNDPAELFNVDRVSRSEGLGKLPADYSKLPPPLRCRARILGRPCPVIWVRRSSSRNSQLCRAIRHRDMTRLHQSGDARRKEAEQAAAASVFFRSGGQRATAASPTAAASAAAGATSSNSSRLRPDGGGPDIHASTGWQCGRHDSTKPARPDRVLSRCPAGRQRRVAPARQHRDDGVQRGADHQGYGQRMHDSLTARRRDRHRSRRTGVRHCRRRTPC